MSTIRFEPIALQIAQLVSLDRLLSPEGGQKPGEAAAVPADTQEFFAVYMRAVQAGFRLLGAPQFERLSRLYDRFQEEFVPGGPPKSPVYDSYATQHILGEVPQGVASETPFSVLARLTSGQPKHEPLQRLALALAGSHLDLYRVTRAVGTNAELERIREEGTLSVRLTGPFLQAGDRMLGRVLPFGGAFFIADSPYLLKAPDADWLEYLARAAGESSPNAASSEAPRPASNAKLTPKERARLRQKRAAAARQSPDAGSVRLLKYGRSERYWLDFIMDAYAGERRGIAFLAGIPDRPETLPHHADYDPSNR